MLPTPAEIDAVADETSLVNMLAISVNGKYPIKGAISRRKLRSIVVCNTIAASTRSLASP
jgi:hypothetical protein